MAFTLSRVDRIPRTYTITATDEDGDPVALTSVDFALVLPRANVNGTTEWTTYPVASGQATVVLAGPDASPTDALVVPASADLHRRWVDGDKVDTEFVERITVLGGGGALSAGTRAIPAGGTNGQVLGIVNGALAWVTVTTFPGTTGTS